MSTVFNGKETKFGELALCETCKNRRGDLSCGSYIYPQWHDGFCEVHRLIQGRNTLNKAGVKRIAAEAYAAGKEDTSAERAQEIIAEEEDEP